MTDYEKFKQPVYRILAEKGFFGPDANLFIQGEVIGFTDEPNEEMEPLNEAARKKMTAYVEKLDGFAKAKAEKEGKIFVSRPRSWQEKMDAEIDDNAAIFSIKEGVPLVAKTKPKTDVIQKIEEAPTTDNRPITKLQLGGKVA